MALNKKKNNLKSGTHFIFIKYLLIVCDSFSNRRNTFHPEVIMVFESKTAAVVDGWYTVVQSDEIEEVVGIILCQTFYFKLIGNKFWMPNSLRYRACYVLMSLQ